MGVWPRRGGEGNAGGGRGEVCWGSGGGAGRKVGGCHEKKVGEAGDEIRVGPEGRVRGDGFEGGDVGGSLLGSGWTE